MELRRTVNGGICLDGLKEKDVFLMLKDLKIEIGRNTFIHTGVVLGEDGFWWHRVNSKLTTKEHTFGIKIGSDCDIGSHTSIHRGRWRDTEIGDGTKIDSFCHVAHNVKIGKDCLITPRVTLLGSVTIGDRVDIGANTVIKNGVHIGDNVTIGANSFVNKDIENFDGTWYGSPAKKERNIKIEL